MILRVLCFPDTAPRFTGRAAGAIECCQQRLGEVRDGMDIADNVGLELADALAERLDVLVPGLDALKVHGKVVDAGKVRSDVAVPQEPLDAPQRPIDLFRFLLIETAADETLGNPPRRMRPG